METMYRSINGEWINYSHVNIDGRPVEKTLDRWPYSYDAYMTWKGDYHKGKGDAVYSDRLYQWDSKKYDECCRAIWNNEGQYFNNREPKDIERFMCLYFGYKIKLTGIETGCNYSTGYPYWVFHFENVKS
jgi:hypothetical protein